MNSLILAVLLSVAVIVSFNLGSKWGAFCIRKDLQKYGNSIIQWGDTAKSKVTGTVEDLRD